MEEKDGDDQERFNNSLDVNGLTPDKVGNADILEEMNKSNSKNKSLNQTFQGPTVETNLLKLDPGSRHSSMKNKTEMTVVQSN